MFWFLQWKSCSAGKASTGAAGGIVPCSKAPWQQLSRFHTIYMLVVRHTDQTQLLKPHISCCFILLLAFMRILDVHQPPGDPTATAPSNDRPSNSQIKQDTGALRGRTRCPLWRVYTQLNSLQCSLLAHINKWTESNTDAIKPYMLLHFCTGKVV